MTLLGPLAIAAAAQSAGATLSVGATVVRPERPQIVIARRRVAVRAVDDAVITVEGGSARRTGAGILLIAPAGSGPVRIVFTY
ncbi:MAG: hypothetical protein E6G92_01370 [Alphaproteobacteria bacterium]|nr:MAG: hypothetical protein E6G92_01370 [Alphaproteobacteria bacterium]